MLSSLSFFILFFIWNDSSIILIFCNTTSKSVSNLSTLRLISVSKLFPFWRWAKTQVVFVVNSSFSCFYWRESFSLSIQRLITSLHWVDSKFEVIQFLLDAFVFRLSKDTIYSSMIFVYFIFLFERNMSYRVPFLHPNHAISFLRLQYSQCPLILPIDW